MLAPRKSTTRLAGVVSGRAWRSNKLPKSAADTSLLVCGHPNLTPPRPRLLPLTFMPSSSPLRLLCPDRTIAVYTAARLPVLCLCTSYTAWAAEPLRIGFASYFALEA